MINKIREAPYDYARDLGYDPESLRVNGIEAETAFKPYEQDSALTQAAVDESASIAGEDISESTAPSIYRFSASTGGVVSFFNFMSREMAFKIVIDYLFEKELETNTFDCVLSKDYAYAGVAITAGKVGSGNAWFVGICLRSAELASEIQMLNLINAVRDNPKSILKYLELDQLEAYDKNKNIEYLSSGEYNPFFFDTALSESAQALSSHLLNDTDETQTALEWAEDYGYTGEDVKDFFLPVGSLPEDNGLSVYTLFLYLMRNELTQWPLSSVAFLKDFQDIGSSISFQAGDKIDTSVLSFVVGRNDPDDGDDETVRIYGLLFSDNDGNDLYAPGEEETCIQQTVTAYNNETQETQTAVTDNAGHFLMKLPANQQYSFTATIEGVPVSWEGNNGDYLITSDQFVKLIYRPAVP